jgi:hypothetical protein
MTPLAPGHAKRTIKLAVRHGIVNETGRAIRLAVRDGIVDASAQTASLSYEPPINQGCGALTEAAAFATRHQPVGRGIPSV